MKSDYTAWLTGAGTFLAALVIVGGSVYFLSLDIRIPGAGPLVPSNTAKVSIGMPTVITGGVPGQASGNAVQAPEGASGSIVKCQLAGKIVYSDTPCGSGGRPVDIIETEGFERPSIQDARVHQPQPTEAQAVEAPTLAGAPSEVDRCQLINNAIKANEDAARRPQTGWTQDRLTEEKRRLLEQKRAQGC
jgi:hypothetical protein